jgi:aryl-alcohol dehydrogenase-like predicted oxidoreductase
MMATQLTTTQLGDTRLEIARVGLGAWAIGGGGWEHGWGPQDDDESITAIHVALDHGINWIDTAAAYGFGHSEQIVGRALQGLSDRPYVFTKCSPLEGPDHKIAHSLKRDSILGEADNSLARLGVDAVDVYQIHWPIRDEDVEEGWAVLAELNDQGLVRTSASRTSTSTSCAGCSRSPRSRRCSPSTRCSSSTPSGSSSHSPEREGIGVIAYSPMGSGMLTGAMTRDRIAQLPDDDWRKHDARFNEPQLSRNLELVERLTRVADHHDTTPGAIAVAWTLLHPGVDGAIVGFRRPDQVDPMLPAASLELTDEEIDEIEGGTR